MTREDHWNTVYTTKSEDQVSWFEALPVVSLRLMEAAGLDQDTCVIDVGGGDSHLVDQLAARGLTCVAVLDASGVALNRAKARLGARASVPEADGHLARPRAVPRTPPPDAQTGRHRHRGHLCVGRSGEVQRPACRPLLTRLAVANAWAGP